MFRLFSKPTKCLFSTARHYCVQTVDKSSNYDFSRVVLCGTVIGQTVHENTGTKVLILQTRDEQTKTLNLHTVNTHIPVDIKDGQRILCKGRVYSVAFTRDDGKTDYRLINSSYLTKLVDPHCSDINFVELHGNIASQVYKRQASTHFLMVSHLRPKAGADMVPHFYRIFVRDERIHGLAQELDKTNRVYLSGSIHNEDVNIANGRTRPAGSILVSQLCKGVSADDVELDFSAPVQFE